MISIAIRVENLSKLYLLTESGQATSAAPASGTIRCGMRSLERSNVLTFQRSNVCG